MVSAQRCGPLGGQIFALTVIQHEGSILSEVSLIHESSKTHNPDSFRDRHGSSKTPTGQLENATIESVKDASIMWDSNLSQTSAEFLLQLGRMFLSTLLLLDIFVGLGVQEVGAHEVGNTSESIVYRAVDMVSCEKDAAVDAAEGGSWFQRAVDTVSGKKDAAGAVVGRVAPEPPSVLTTASSAIGGLIDAAGAKGSDIADPIIRAGSSAWAALSESELAALLNSTVHWAAYEDVMTDHPELRGTAGPVVEFATGLSPDGEIAARDIVIIVALLAVPAGKLGSILGKGGKQAVRVGPDVLILVDNVVVAKIEGGSGRVVGAVEGSIDDLGRVVVRNAPGLRQVLLTNVPIQAQQVVMNQLKALKSGGARESGPYFANAGMHLPNQPPDYYREYLVESPDSQTMAC